MADAIQPVQPGQVISSALINQIIAKLQELEQAITTGGGGGQTGGQVVISNFDPLGQQHIGQILTIFGTNLPFPPTGNSVTLNGTPVPFANFQFDSTSSKLRFIVPDVPGVTGPMQVVVMVSGQAGQQQSSYTLLPRLPNTGPPPVMTSATDLTTNTVDVLGILHTARISGSNFAANPAQNVVTFSLQPAVGPPVVYPKSGQSIAIDAANSDTSKIQLTVPDITEITQGMGVVPVTLQITVGNNTPAARIIQVFRP